MSTTTTKKLARAREVCNGAGFLLLKLQSKFGDQFGEGMRIQVQQCINECRQQGTALFSAADAAARAESAGHGARHG
jgi:hypothetical protein